MVNRAGRVAVITRSSFVAVAFAIALLFGPPAPGNVSAWTVPAAHVQSFSEIKRKAEAGDANAQWELAHRYYKARGVKRSYSKARRWFRRAADQGVGASYDFLGEMYYLGRGVKKNYRLTRKYWRLSSEAGLDTGHYNLAGAYFYGIGGSKRRSEAIRLWRLSASMGNEGAVEILRKNGYAPVDPRQVQQRLTDLGYDPGPIDGKPGRKTREAIRAFQRDESLSVDGKLTVSLMAALNKTEQQRKVSPSTPSPPTTITSSTSSTVDDTYSADANSREPSPADQLDTDTSELGLGESSADSDFGNLSDLDSLE